MKLERRVFRESSYKIVGILWYDYNLMKGHFLRVCCMWDLKANQWIFVLHIFVREREWRGETLSPKQIWPHSLSERTQDPLGSPDQLRTTVLGHQRSGDILWANRPCWSIGCGWRICCYKIPGESCDLLASGFLDAGGRHLRSLMERWYVMSRWDITPPLQCPAPSFTWHGASRQSPELDSACFLKSVPGSDQITVFILSHNLAAPQHHQGKHRSRLPALSPSISSS